MHNECVVAVYENSEQARLAAHTLESSEFPNDQVSLVISNLEKHADVEADLQAGEDEVRDVMVGGGLGSLIGLIAGASIVVSGGMMILVIGSLAGLVAGGIAGTFLGAIEGWGVHGHRVKYYELLVNAGHPIIVAHGDPLQVVTAYRLLQQTAPKELHLYTSTTEGSPSVD